MRKINLFAAVLASVTLSSPAFAVIDGPVLWGYQHSMQSTGSSELGLPPFRKSTRYGCASAPGLVEYGCDPHPSRSFRR